MTNSIFIRTREGKKEIIINEGKWVYADTLTEIDEIARRAMSRGGLSVTSIQSVSVPYNASFLATITQTPKHFWLNSDDSIRSQIQEVMDKALAAAKPELLEIRENYLKKVQEKRNEAIAKSKCSNKTE